MPDNILIDEVDPSNSELKHYGVLGMKWGVRRAQYKSSQNAKLRKKALQLDAKEARLTKKAEEAHSKNDLGKANKKAVRASNYSKRAAKLDSKSLSANTDFEKSRLHAKAEKYRYKAMKSKRTANRLSKSVGYGKKAMAYSIKSDRIAVKAAKARKRIANNELYIDLMNAKVSDFNRKSASK